MRLQVAVAVVLGSCLAAPVRAAGADLSAEAPAKADWPTAAHDMLRTDFTAQGPAPPLRARWVWADGKLVDPEAVKRTNGACVWQDISVLPDFSSARFFNQAQPMAAGGVAYIGSVEGELFAIDVKTGETKWRQTVGGPVVHSVTIADGTVFVPTLRGVDAVGLDGKKLWTFEDPHLCGFKSCPAVMDGLVLIGGPAGFFYGLDAKTGKLAWEYKVGAPIYQTAAAYDGTVYFGAEDLRVRALEIKTGKEKWTSERLAGATMGLYWPVIAAKEGVVMVRTGCWAGLAGGNTVKDAPFDYVQAQDALRKYLFEDAPQARSFFVLKLADGKEKVKVACGYFGVSADIPPPPVVRDDGSVLNYFYAKEGAMQKTKSFGLYGVPVDFGRINFETGYHERIASTGTTSPPSITRNDDFHQVSLGGNYLFGVQMELVLGCVPLDGKGPGFGWNMAQNGAYKSASKRGLIGGLPRHEHGGMGPAVLSDVVLFNPGGGAYLVAFESKGGN